MTTPSPNLVYTEGAAVDNKELPALPSPNMVYPESASRDNKELPAFYSKAVVIIFPVSLSELLSLVLCVCGEYCFRVGYMGATCHSGALVLALHNLRN